jgi:hypothetical protein
MKRAFQLCGVSIGLALFSLLSAIDLAAPADSRGPTTRPTSRPAVARAAATRPATTRPAVAGSPTTRPVAGRPIPPTPPTPPPPAVSPEPPQPNIAYVFPAGGRRGTTVQVNVGGTSLRDLKSVTVTGAGVVATSRSEVMAGGKEGSVANAAGAGTLGGQVRVWLTISPDAELGERDLRVVSPGGASNRYRFTVSDLPEVVRTGPNPTLAAAQKLDALPAIINGQVQQADRHFYRFPAKAGQTIVCDVAARRIVPYIADAVPGWLDAYVVLYDADGRTLAAVDDDRFKPDPVMFYAVPKDGDYVIEIRDIIFRGRSDFVYRMTLGALPFMQRIWPLGGRCGSTVEVTRFGVGLAETRTPVQISSDGPAIRTISAGPGGLPWNTLPFHATRYPETQPVAPNHVTTQPCRVNFPVAINGRIEQPNVADYYAFSAKAKDKLVMEIFARRLDSSLDSILTLYDAATGRELAENDDLVDPDQPLVTHHADSRLVFTFDKDGTYLLRIRDVQGHGGPDYGYRLLIHPVEPDFTLRVTPDNPRVGQGGSAAMTVDALRKDGFAEEIKVTMDGLPKGFVMSEAVIPTGQDQARFTITAPLDAAIGVCVPQVSGSAKLGDATVTRQAFSADAVQQAFGLTYNVPTREFMLSVSARPAFTLAADMGDKTIIELPQDGTVQLPLRVVRKDGVKGQIALTNTGRAQNGVQVRTPFIPADKDEVTLVLTAMKPPVGTKMTMIIQGELRVGKDTIHAITPAYMVVIVAPPAK